ncbi:MAG: sensor histidine kinase [Thermomonas sp.]|uniref:sensor histidine kinase n=1 Tax=Thermomonas sp. TaxID=1971895 RepID=UPI0039E40D12
MLLLFLLLPAFAFAPTPAQQLAAGVPHLSLEGRLDHFADADGKLSIQEITQPGFVQQHFVRLPDNRSLGYDSAAHWFHAALNPAADAPRRWVLAIGSPELEEVDVWVEQAGGGFRLYAMGYHRPYKNRPLHTRLFALPTDVFPGMRIFLRVRTHNTINVHADLWQVDAYTASETRSNFHRGGYFGILLIAVALYLILGARLRDVVMTSYAGYIVSQMLFNLGTNGYLPVLLDSPWFTDALPRIGWLGGSVCIVLMWDKLLGLKRTHPRIHRLYLFTLFLNLCLLPFVLMPSLVNAWVMVAVKLANYLNSLNIFISLVLLLHFWRQSRRGELMVYFIAFVIPAIGVTVNTAANHGLLSQNVVTSNLYQFAPLVHVLVMSYGLALRLRQLQHDKVAAQQEVAAATQRSEDQRRFVAMLSHEFGNPLAAIDRAAQMMQIKLPDLPQSEAQRLTQIRGNATALSGLVENFLATEALDHGALPMSRAGCDIQPMLESVIDQQPESERTRIRLHVSPADAHFDVDRALLALAVGNLLGNALRYSPAGSAVELNAALDADGLRIRVTDHGSGLDAETLEKLGTPYFRAATSLGKKGSGLGFHFTRRIVEAHGGELLARSPQGQGLEVEIVLPRR